MNRIFLVLIIAFSTGCDTCILARGKGKAIPLQAWRGPYGSRMLRFPEFVDSRNMKVTTFMFRLSTVLSPGRLYPQEITLVLTSVTGRVETRTTVRPDGLNQ